MASMLANESTRRRLLIGVAIAILAVYALVSVWDVGTATERLAAAEDDFAELQTKLAQMEQWKDAPRVAALEIESPSQITNRISAAREAAVLPQSSLMREQPSAPQRIGRTDFELRSTTIQLSASTLSQIMAFCDALRDEQSGTLVRDLRLSIPQNDASSAGGEVWEAEMTLTQTIFSPNAK